jgi:carbon storage regulator
MPRLTLTRNLGESLIIGDDIVVTVVSRSAKQVRLCIEAPEHVRVIRAELQDLDEPQGEADGPRV